MNQVLYNVNVVKNRDTKLDYLYHIILYVSAFCDFYISVGSSSFKLFYLISIPCLVISFVNILKTKLTKIDFLFLFWIFASIFALNVTLSISDVIVCMIGEFILFLLYKDVQFFLKKYNVSSNSVVNFISKVILVFCLYGIFQYLVYKFVGINIGVTHLTMFPRPRSVFSEPDWLGMYSCIGSSIYLIKLIYNTKNVKFNLFCFFVCFITMLLSFTRAAWVAFAFGVIILLIILKGKSKNKIVFFFLVGIIASLLIILIMSMMNNQYINSFLNRLNPFKWTSHDGGASDTRKYSIEIMLYYIKLNPIFGNGSGSMNYISSNTDLLSSLGYYYEINAGRGNANIVLATLFDIGIVGFVFFLYLIILIYRNCLYLKNCKRSDYQYLRIVSIIVFWNLMIDFQFNNGIRFATVWLFFGVVVFYSNSIKNKKYN